MARGLAVFVTCFVTWMLLAGQFRAIDFVFGALAAAFVTRINRDLEQVSEIVRHGPALLRYVPWLLREVWLANVQVVKIVLHPRLPVDPVLVRVPVRLSSDLARTVFANSITLTPGTITIEAGADGFLVHALTRAGADDLLRGTMARRVGRIFGDQDA